MIYIYFFIKSLINLSRNSVRFENSPGNWLSDRLNLVRFEVWHVLSLGIFLTYFDENNSFIYKSNMGAKYHSISLYSSVLLIQTFVT